MAATVRFIFAVELCLSGAVAIASPGGRVLQELPHTECGITQLETKAPAFLAQAPMEAAVPAAAPANKPAEGTPKAGEAKPGEAKPGEAKPGEAKPEEKKEPKVIERPTKTDKPADPNELKVVPDKEGKVRFNFSGQPWLGVLEWLADISHLSLDWQELPADFLNVRTQRDYTIEETQDVINRHLLMRGFTMIRSGEMLNVVKLDKINPALVPRIEPSDLDGCRDYEYVKTSFPLGWMIAEKAVEEFKPMLSPNHKISALKGMNRIEVMDAAANLKDVARILKQAQTDDGSKDLVVKVFGPLKYRRASEVAALVEAMIGLDKIKMPKGGGGGGGRGDMASMQILQQQQQMMQMLQQQRGNQPGAPGGAPAEDPKLIVDEHKNTILVHATADKLEIIAQTIEAIDVPSDQANSFLNTARFKSYRLSTVDPQKVLTLLSDLGDLSTLSRLEVDEKNGAIILFGTLADHYTVQKLIEKLDTSARNFDVIPLRRLRADQVAGTIEFMLGGKKDDDQNQNPYRYYFGYGSSRQNENEDKRPFKVDADIDNNKLLVWANQVEMDEVKNLLAKMGEILPGMTNPETMRTFDLDTDEQAEKLLERVKEFWPELERLKIEGSPRRANDATSPELDRKEKKNRPPRAAIQSKAPYQIALWEGEGTDADSKPDQTPNAKSELSERNRYDAVAPDNAKKPEQAPKSQQPPQITIQRGPNGKLFLSSPDTEALDRLEQFMSDLAPPKQDFKVYHLRNSNTSALYLRWNLEDYFKDPDSTETKVDYWSGSTYKARKGGGQRLSRKRELRFIDDEVSHTVMVQGATPEQFEIIDKLVEEWDPLPTSDPKLVRRTEFIKLEYSQAPVIATAVKQVFRDLLSVNDPELQNPNNNKEHGKENAGITYNINRGSTDEEKRDTPQAQRFRGLLSVGVDEVSNSIVVSAAGPLFDKVSKLINDLDNAAKPDNAVQVFQVQNLNTASLKERLEKSFAPTIRKSMTNNRQFNQQQQQPGQQQPNQNQNQFQNQNQPVNQ